MSSFPHDYSFDPTYGYDLEALLRVPAPEPPEDFTAFWSARYRRALEAPPRATLHPCDWGHPRFQVFDVEYQSTGRIRIGGWAMLPTQRPVRRGFVVGHGYGGREAPDFDLPFDDAALLFPCFRGMSRSRCADIPESPYHHVLHHIESPDQYVLGGCVDDLWLGVSALNSWVPETAGHVGYLGISFGGGIGALALPWDSRIQRAHYNVPTFGNQALRLTLPTVGSGESVRSYLAAGGNVSAILHYYDAAMAARFVRVPVLVAAARFDPAVAPPGQFAIYNGLGGEKSLFLLDAGHFDYPAMRHQQRQLSDALQTFFDPL